MSSPSLHQLERDVGAARAKLAGQLSRLRSPDTYSEFSSELKYEALEMKDSLVDKAKSSMHSTIDTFIEYLKARAAANPVAALAIGAGIAWRLVQRPPIATALIGAGLYSLFRTTPPHGTDGKSRTRDHYLNQAKDRLAEQASELAETVKDSASAIGQATAEKATELATEVKERAVAMGTRAQAQHWSQEKRSAISRAAGDASSRGGEAFGSLEDIPIQEAGDSQKARDKFLLGAAGIAVVAALGIAWQRRLSEPAGADH